MKYITLEIDNCNSMRQLILFLLLPLFLATCTSPREAFENQDYEKAYRLALASLNKGKGGKEERSVLKRSLKNILELEGAESRRLAGSERPESWEEALEINYRLQERVREASAFLPDKAFEKESKTLLQQAEGLGKQLYGHFFAEGREGLSRATATGLKEYARLAHGAFTKARQYAETPSPALDSLIQEAYKKGVAYYWVKIDMPFDVIYSWEADQVFSDLEDQSGDFLRVSFNEPISNADCIMEIRFSSLDTDIREEVGDEDFNREVIVDYETVTDTAGNETRTPVYGTVEGNVLIITRTKTVEWEAEAAIDALTPNCNLSSQGFSATTRSIAREVRTSGDERAIPEEYLDAPQEGFREEDDMVEDLLEDLYEQVVRAYF